MKGNEQGLQQAEGLIAAWIAERKIDPEKVEVEYIYSNGGNPAFGISHVIWENHQGWNGARRGKVAHFSARWTIIRASGATLRGALLSGKEDGLRLGVVVFPGRHNEDYVADAISWIAEIDYDAWKADWFPVLRDTEAV